MNDIDKRVTALEIAIQELQRFKNSAKDEDIISGKTSATANTKLTWKHKLNRTPTRWYPVKGCVYVQDMDGTTVDIRSTKTNEVFQIIVS